MIRFTGINRSGAHVIGQTAEPASVFVEAKYRARWQKLAVTAIGGPEAGEVIGEIHNLTDDGHRTWWAFDPEPTAQEATR